MGKKENHKFDKDLGKHHKEPNSTENGACLNEHGEGRNTNSCGHQWQAVKKAEEHLDLYNYPAYQSLCGEGHYVTPWQRSNRTWYMANRKRPQLLSDGTGSWDLGKAVYTKADGQVVSNYDTSTLPFWHNAHHIIPNSTLNNELNSIPDNLKSLVRGGLLDAKYNLNHKINMVILPMSKDVAAALGLPRHLTGNEPVKKRTPKRKERAPKVTDHPNYSKLVKYKIKPVVDNYKAAAKKALKKCKEPDGEYSKVKLEKISIDIFNQLKQVANGLALDDVQIRKKNRKNKL